MAKPEDRIKRELKDIEKCNGISGISLGLVEDNLTTLVGQISGPPDTAYEGGIFDLAIDIPPRYPFDPPKIRFKTRVWHPNISSVTGAICLDVLGSKWAAAMTIQTTLLSIQSLLESPEIDDPQDAIVARQLRDHPEVWQLTARYWSQRYAQAPGAIHDAFAIAIQSLLNIGFPEEQAIASLSQNNWNVETSLLFLLDE